MFTPSEIRLSPKHEGVPGTDLDTLPRYRFDASRDKILENA
ncbi:MAG: hypothetical protein O6831_07005 [Alphaproteobacteria bacterium]|nr:hypothetical protein [Alphaproteobacteria bacterium]